MKWRFHRANILRDYGRFDPLPPRVQMEDWLAAFYIYLDDSGKYANPRNDYVSFCGYIAHGSEATRFGQEWTNLRHTWEVPPIHMSPIMYPDRDQAWQAVKDKWGASWEKKRDRMLGEFAQVVLRNSMLCVGSVVDAKHYRGMAQTAFTKNLNPISFAFQQAITRGIESTEIVDKHSPIAIVIDDDRESSLHCYEMLHSLKAAFPKIRERVDGISFVSDGNYPVLQAADMIAYESRQLMEEKAKNPSAESSEIFAALTRWGIHQPKLFTAERLDSMEAESLAALQKAKNDRGETA